MRHTWKCRDGEEEKEISSSAEVKSPERMKNLPWFVSSAVRSRIEEATCVFAADRIDGHTESKGLGVVDEEFDNMSFDCSLLTHIRP